MNYDDAVKIWAAKKLDIRPESIFSVTWGGKGEAEKSYDQTYGDTDGYDVVVHAGCWVHYAHLAGYGSHRRNSLIELSGQSFASVLAEILGAS